ncbi:MAG: hypothetical protein PHR28_04985 [candidate division Zixibacteria bacterium]|nr:hypothetical protein [candidate division Zixibacteria bacterium]
MGGLLLAGALVMNGCQGGGKPAAKSNAAPYAVVDSLLGSSYHIPGTGITLRVPIGFDPAADSILLMLQNRLAQGVGPEGGVRMVSCFLDTIHTAGLMVSVIEDPTVRQDTGAFFGRYRQSLYGYFGADKVRETEFMSDSVFLKIFSTPEETMVRVECLCLPVAGDLLELTYFMQKEWFALLEPRIQSSIGDISYSTRSFRPGVE